MDRQREIPAEAQPGRPLLVFDGDCEFCRTWVDRWRSITGERIEYRTYQDVAADHPEIGVEEFEKAVWLIEPDGKRSSGAGAVLRLYELAGEKRWLKALYDDLPGFAAVTESGYRLVARHRGGASWLTRCLWGRVAQRPRYRRMRSIFLRALGAVYLMAFWSLGVQVDGLIGSRGILPVDEFLRSAKLALGDGAYRLFPTLLWFDSSDRALHLLCWGGVLVSALLVAGVLPGVSLALLWVFYLSLTVAGQEFLSFQWDVLLLETGLLAILFSPWGVWLGRARGEPSRGVVWLLRWLVFRLMFLSAMVKLTSGDQAWRSWTALNYHYETQPLPPWTSWYMHQLPAWFQTMSAGVMFWSELIAPFFVFGPRRVRMVGFWSIVLLQVLIAATGNYGCFNALSLVLCVTLVEDRDWGAQVSGQEEPRTRGLKRVLIGAVGVVVVLVTTMQGISRTWPAVEFPGLMEDLRRWVEPLRSMNAYGLFAVMTTERKEIEVEASDDGVTWKPYQFPWKPGELDRRPRFTTPHMPRLDWQMWFAALAPNCWRQPWFLKFEQRLLEGSPPVLKLLRENPFPDRPPRYIRSRLYLYHFTKWGSRAWWQREDLGLYCPPVRL